MSLRSVQNMCKLLTVLSSVALIASIPLSSYPLMYIGVMGTVLHGIMNLAKLRCPTCRGRLAGVSGDVCPHCGHKIPWDAR